jgi:probable F420-dependent oxidoreductase
MMRYWVNAVLLEVEQLTEVARHAELLGFEGITLADHLVFPEHFESAYPYSADGNVAWPVDAPWPECWVSIAAMAQVTQRLRFTTSILVAPLRDVFSLAKSVGTAAGFGSGRVSCGLGAGWLREEFETVGQDFATRGARMDEMLEVLRMLWTGEVVEYHGEHIDFGPLRMRPAAGEVPILVGGNTAPALRRAARSDGWIGNYTNSGDVGRMLSELADNRERNGRTDSAFEILLTARPGVASDAAALEDLGVDGLIIPTLALAPSSQTSDLLVGLERFAQRNIR